MPLIFNPWAILIAVALLAGTHGMAYWQGVKHERNEIAAAELIREQTIEAARLGAAEAIAKIEVRHTTIRQTVEKEIHERPVYVSCAHSSDVLRMLNEALASEYGQPAGSGQLPEAGAAGRPDVRIDDTKAARGNGRLLSLQGGGLGGR